MTQFEHYQPSNFGYEYAYCVTIDMRNSYQIYFFSDYSDLLKDNTLKNVQHIYIFCLPL